ncbi:class I SAM-dependent methyltransferase [Pseudomonas sp. 14P_8.1_Bac3]|uniref:class I SAM-dependent methyltransferase n=1 Tax=Pseudomonas sp. 14P_8.1_Bac3 TaxID=2971621 RepID=UPI0021C657E2|nr:class I SAM-dependent methyltransferase [Pseudomonas sp. 14P_8.1_Bac3]MCU1762153.1 class I SAM-dependent methyltransferase [Pseudomonas sp. 14P_8.1_Bac3]
MTSPNRSPFPSSAYRQLADAESGHWWFRVRNKIVLWALNNKIAPFNNFLEIGCGTGYVLEGISQSFPNIELYGSEYFEEGLEHARKRVPESHLMQLDAITLNEVERYDVIGAFDVIEHIEDDEVVIANLARAIRSGGSLILTVPQHRWLWSKVDEYACHVRRYTRAELVTKVQRAGLSVTYSSSFVSLLVPLMWLSRKHSSKQHEPMSEFQIPRWLNKTLEVVMNVEFLLLRLGVRFPIGGSLLLIAKKPEISLGGL